MLSAFSVKLWQFYGATALQFLKYTQWGLSQSLLSKCVSKDDIGKMYGVCGIISALIPFASNGILRFVHVFTILIIKFTLPDLTVLVLVRKGIPNRKYRTCTIIGHSRFEAALVYKPRILGLKNEEFPFLV